MRSEICLLLKTLLVLLALGEQQLLSIAPEDICSAGPTNGLRSLRKVFDQSLTNGEELRLPTQVIDTEHGD